MTARRRGVTRRVMPFIVLACAAADSPLAAQDSTVDREIVAEMNRARTDPAAYARLLEEMLPRFRGTSYDRPDRVTIETAEGPHAVREAITTLRRTRPLPPLDFSPGLARAARDHAEDQGRNGGMGHAGADGSRMAERISRYGTWGGSAAENIAYGSETPRDVVIDLLVDDGVPGRGHRENILDPASRFAGAGCARHPEYRIVCVIDFAGDYREAAGSAAREPPPSGDSVPR